MSYYVMTSNKPVIHKEGDVWEENGKTWTIKNGIKKTLGKMDNFRKELIMPIACPHCKRPMKTDVQKPFWSIYKMCLDCVVDMEHVIRTEGKWEEYEKAKITANATSFYKELEQYVQDFIKEKPNKGFVTEDGVVESWIGNSETKAKEIGETELNQLKGVIDEYTNK
jgi:hypothetical protein